MICTNFHYTISYMIAFSLPCEQSITSLWNLLFGIFNRLNLAIELKLTIYACDSNIISIKFLTVILMHDIIFDFVTLDNFEEIICSGQYLQGFKFFAVQTINYWSKKAIEKFPKSLYYPLKQCAAVRTHLSEMIAHPQICILPFCSEH